MDCEIEENEDTILISEECEMMQKIMQSLFQILRLKSIGKFNFENENFLKFVPIFSANLMNSNCESNGDKIDDNPPDLRLLCDCLKRILPQSARSGKWIAMQNADLRQLACSASKSTQSFVIEMQHKLSFIESQLQESILPNVCLQCWLIENILLLLYFHCDFYLHSAAAADFYHKFNAVVMSEVVQALTDWYQDDECLLHVRHEMLQQYFETPKSTKIFIEIMLEKFHILDRDNRKMQMIQN